MKKEKKKRNNLFYDFVKITGMIPAFLYVLPKLYYPFGKPSVKGPTLVISNHTSFMDPVTLLCTFPTRRLIFVGTTDLFRTKLGRWYFEHVNTIEIDKTNFSMDTFHKIKNELQRGSFIGIFPEGYVHPGTDTIDSFKSGVVLMAMQGKSDIIPVYVCPRGKWPHRTKIYVGNRIAIPSFEKCPSMNEIDKITEDLFKVEAQLKELCDKKEK